MIRIVIENVLLFLAPTLIYVAYMLLVRSQGGESQRGGAATASDVINDAPLLWLFVVGALLVLITMFAFATESGGRPGQHYTPPSMKDGKIEQGQFD